MEKRRFPRQDVRGTVLKATLVLAGGSLLDSSLFSAVEIDARPTDLSQGGVCVTLGLDAHWATISREREIDFILTNGLVSEHLKTRVAWLKEGGQTLGLEFKTPLHDAARFLLPAELHR